MQHRYSLGAIIFHWLIAAALAFQLSVGFGLDDVGPRGFALFQLHKSVGIAILLLTLLRIGWRFTAPRPAPTEHGWQGRLAGIVHFGLYLFMLGAPLSGWLMVSTAKVAIPTVLFGLLPWPHIPLPHALNPLFDGAHSALGVIGLTLVALHIAGALRHQWMLRDNLLARMSPGRTAWPVLPLALLLVLAWGAGLLALSRVPQESAKPAIPTRTPEPSPVAVAAPPPVSVEIPATKPTKPPTWTIKPGGTLSFSVGNGNGRIAGRFGKWSGAILLDPERLEGADIRMTVDLASASVGDATQDAILASADFFDASANPRAVYHSGSVRRTAPGHYAASGILTLKGRARPLDLAFTLTGDGLARHVQGHATIARTAYGIGSGDNARTLGNSVSLSFSFDAKGKSPQ